MNELLELLRAQAADEGDFARTLTEDYSWKVDTNSARVHVQAVTRKLSADPDEAWRSAIQLRDAILAIGYKLYSTCQVGVVSEIGPEDPDGPDSWQLPICGWRGFVSLVMTPTSF